MSDCGDEDEEIGVNELPAFYKVTMHWDEADFNLFTFMRTIGNDAMEYWLKGKVISLCLLAWTLKQLFI